MSSADSGPTSTKAKPAARHSIAVTLDPVPARDAAAEKAQADLREIGEAREADALLQPGNQFRAARGVDLHRPRIGDEGRIGQPRPRHIALKDIEGDRRARLAPARKDQRHQRSHGGAREERQDG